ncbi:patatin-like phospholipase family protein [uncultured Chryseobacterium sp.]|uniref:patatin-like phospholipase family protein n=1 Tax=uncultured Chryseobacterium sp. TaxID=259322 RepID=UPI0025FD43C4|nr:patatin-like phospholipase family protein [uncultured Chryseobacterium sp.]
MEINKKFDKILSKYGTCIFKGSEDQGTLLKRISDLSEKGKSFSDITSMEDGRKLYWVDFVQQGGGVLGYSLVGYTFVLEYLGIRFLRLAGTSAGAINTVFLAAIGEKNEPKSPELYDLIFDDKRFDVKGFVDTKNIFLRQLILRGKGLIMNFLGITLVLLLLVLFPLPILSHVGMEGKVVYGIFMLIFLLWTGYIFSLIGKFTTNKFGINPGDTFESFLENELEKFGVKDQEQLDQKAKLTFTLNPETRQYTCTKKGNLVLTLESEDPMQPAYHNLKTDYSFVTTDIYNECKIVLPKEVNLYFGEDEARQNNPAKYVRSSMAIPFFFKPKIFKTYNEMVGEGQDRSFLWETWKGKERKNVKSHGILIDGGSLSNFPINLFHNNEITIPRLPIFGARIVDEKPIERRVKDGIDTKENISFGSFIWQIINTIRSNEDNSFLAINPFYKKYCISEIKVYKTEIDWLNFNLTSNEKDALFLEGVEAALEFLEKFDWAEYKKQRQNIKKN